MKLYCLLRFFYIIAISIVVGCAANSTDRAPATKKNTVKPAAFNAPENQYYYITAAQIQRKKGNLDQAILLLRKALNLDPDSPYLQRELATVYLQNKEGAKAIEVLEELLRRHPDDIKALIIYGGTKQVRKENADAIAAYEKILALDPKQERVYSLLGNLYDESGDVAKAQATFKRLIESFPSSFAGRYYLGRIYAKQKKFKAAEKEFLKALELVPDRHEPRFELINLYKEQGKTGQIIGLYEDVIRNNPNNIRAAVELGFYYQQLGMKSQSQKILHQLGLRSRNEFEVIITVIQLYIDPKKYKDGLIVVDGMLKGQPDSPDLHHLAGIAYYGQKKYQQAIVHFKRVTPLSRFYQDAVVHVAFILQDDGKSQEAVGFLTAAIEKDPDNADFKYYLGTFYEELEDFEKAEYYIRQAIEIEPDNPRYYFRLGVVYDKDNRKQESMDTMRKVIELDPKHANAMNYLGYTYADLGQNLDEAERLIKEALKYKPNDGYITDSLGWVYYKKGQFDKAIKYLKRAVELVPNDPIMLEHMGDAYLKLNDKPNALKYYRKSLEIKDKDKEALQEKIRKLGHEGS
ncbi:MAG: tetratricopeptide repeat protein [Deltaproteobacteria bacterium]|jgi:tetratricopeptide (TPR) repeat protein|nr:tetratricopeptide repeat protein [Deltaproteobacteria bacterium]